PEASAYKPRGKQPTDLFDAPTRENQAQTEASVAKMLPNPPEYAGITVSHGDLSSKTDTHSVVVMADEPPPSPPAPPAMRPPPVPAAPFAPVPHAPSGPMGYASAAPYAPRFEAAAPLSPARPSRWQTVRGVVTGPKRWWFAGGAVATIVLSIVVIVAVS